MLTKIGRFAVGFFQCRFVVPEIEMTGGAGHEQLNHAFGAGGVVQAGHC